MISHTDTRLPVTVLSGFLGAGKTTALNWLFRKICGWILARASLQVDVKERLS